MAEVLSSRKQVRSCLFCSSACKGDEDKLLVQHSCRGGIYLSCDDGVLNTSQRGEGTGDKPELSEIQEDFMSLLEACSIRLMLSWSTVH